MGFKCENFIIARNGVGCYIYEEGNELSALIKGQNFRLP